MKNLRGLTVLTVGHSTHSYERFLGLLRSVEVTAIADVRTSPFSRHQPHFNRDALKAELKLDQIAYSFLGKELGGRPSHSGFYCEGVADYERMAETKEFESGLVRVMEGAQKYRIALMCSEHDPLDCHRCLLVGRDLAKRNVSVKHILSGGQIVSQQEIEDRLLTMSRRESEDLFAPPNQRLAAAYRARSRKVAFAEPRIGPQAPMAAE